LFNRESYSFAILVEVNLTAEVIVPCSKYMPVGEQCPQLKNFEGLAPSQQN